MAASSITLLQTIEWAKRFIFQRRTNFGNFNEPAISSANIVMQTILGPPFAWQWNRAVTGFICTPGQQDYTIFNWVLDSPVQIGYVLVDSNGNSQSVTTPGTTGSTVPTWNTVTGQITTDGTAVWTNNGPIGLSNGSTSYNFAWIETVSVKTCQSSSNTFNDWKEISPKVCLGTESGRARPHSIAAQFQDANGNITFRLMPVPDKSYPVSIAIQQTPPLFTELSQSWSPIPDRYSHIYNWGFLSLMFMFADDARFQFANQKFIAHLLSSNHGLTETEINIMLNNWQAITGQQIVKSTDIQQSFTGRQAL